MNLDWLVNWLRRLLILIREFLSTPLEEREYPLITKEQVVNLIKEIIDFEWDEENPDMIFETTIHDDNTPDEYGYYGSRGTTLIDGEKKIVGYLSIAELRVILERYADGRPKSGAMAFSLYFDPNNGWIKKLVINPDYVPGDHEQIKRSTKENPNYNTYLNLI